MSQTSPSKLAQKLSRTPRPHTNDNPVWQGPCGQGWNGGVTQSMIARFLSCRERFRLKYVLGLEPHPKWNHKLGYGQMWHVCEEALSAFQPGYVTGEPDIWEPALNNYTLEQIKLYPLQRDDIEKWYNVCCVQFPEYVNYWKDHPDVLNRTPLLQEQVFDVPYTLPSGRVVRLRGRWDSVDLIKEECRYCKGVGNYSRFNDDAEFIDCIKCSGSGRVSGVYLQENKTKGDVDQLRIERQLSFDLQTMMYLVALGWKPSCEDTPPMYYRHGGGNGLKVGEYPIKGVRYNVVRRPLSGGRGNISPHKEKATKTKYTPAETAEQFYERLRRDYIVKEPEYWFFRIRAEISQKEIEVFRQTCLDPILETMCIWYEQLTGRWDEDNNPDAVVYGSSAIPPMNYRTPFGVFSALEEGGATEYDAYMREGMESGLRRVEELFTELK